MTMKTTIKISGIAAAAAALIATGVNTSGHSVDASTSVSLADKSCHSKKGCEKKEGHKDGEKKDVAGSL